MKITPPAAPSGFSRNRRTRKWDDAGALAARQGDGDVGDESHQRYLTLGSSRAVAQIDREIDQHHAEPRSTRLTPVMIG